MQVCRLNVITSTKLRFQTGDYSGLEAWLGVGQREINFGLIRASAFVHYRWSEWVLNQGSFTTLQAEREGGKEERSVHMCISMAGLCTFSKSQLDKMLEHSSRGNTGQKRILLKVLLIYLNVQHPQTPNGLLPSLPICYGLTLRAAVQSLHLKAHHFFLISSSLNCPSRFLLPPGKYYQGSSIKTGIWVEQVEASIPPWRLQEGLRPVASSQLNQVPHRVIVKMAYAILSSLKQEKNYINNNRMPQVPNIHPVDY